MGGWLVTSLKIIPNDIQNLEPGEEIILNKIKQIYSNVNWNAYLYVQPHIKKWTPDFILVDEYKGISIIEVKDWSLDFIYKIDHKSVVVNGTTRNNPIYVTNKYFNTVKDLLQLEHSLLENNELKYRIYSNLVFTNIESNELEYIQSCISQPPTKCITSGKIITLSIEDIFGYETKYIEEYDFSTIRSVFFPESKDPKILQKKLWEFHRRDTKENSIIKMLDIEQEKFANRVPYGHYMVSGIPGSGKTVILLARAVYLAGENPNWRIIILTYTNSLTTKLQNKLESMHEDLDNMGIKYENIEIATFHSLAKSVANVGIIPSPTPKDYWKTILPYKAIENARATYDAILIDEYQDFYDSWISLCLILCKKYEYKNQMTENLFLAGDRLQSIYNDKDSSWKSLGVNIAGRSKLLKSSYRSGSNHINLALDYLMKDEKLEKEVEKFYEGRNGICCKYESENCVDFISGGLENINGYLIDLFSNQKYNPEDVLVLVPNSKGPNNKDEIYQKLDIQLKSISIASKEVEPNKMTVTTYHSSKGLECKVCILLNVDNLNDKKLLYVGMTRASEKLCIHSFSPDEGKIFKELLSCYEELMAPIKNDTLSYEILNDLDMYDKTPSSIENIRKEHPNAYKAWGKQEELELINLYNSGESIEEIAESLGRQYGGIKSRLKKLGLISDDVRPIKNVNVETKYPIKSEHLTEPDLWEE